MEQKSQTAGRAPGRPGVYRFWSGTEMLYIGKAANIHKRLASYFRANAPDKVRRLIAEADRVDWIEAGSEAEAFLAEAELIKKHQPKFNVLMRDDKNYFFVGITREEFPRIFITHQPVKIRNSNFSRRTYQNVIRRSGFRPASGEIRNKFQNSKIKNSKLVSDFGFRASDFASYVGPFTSGSALKIVLRLLRRIFPYCTCKKPHTRPCLNSQIGRCMGYCCIRKNHESRIKNHGGEEYKNNIKGLTAVLNGKKKRLAGELRREMKQAARGQQFERAAKLRDQIEGLENIFSHKPVLQERPAERHNAGRLERALQALFGGEHAIRRAEAYDIANIAGEAATGSMVVFVEGRPAKADYRIFNVKTVRGISDVDMMREVISRRLRHPEWQYPNLMVIDGGKPQLNAALSAVGSWELGVGRQKLKTPNAERRTNVLVVALAKREEELYFPNKKSPVRLDSLPPEANRFFKHIRDEAHRFARKQHHRLRRKQFSPV